MPYLLHDINAMRDSARAEFLKYLAGTSDTIRAKQAMARINARIANFERRYELSSAEMIKQLSAGKIRETAEIAQWLFLLEVRAENVEA